MKTKLTILLAVLFAAFFTLFSSSVVFAHHEEEGFGSEVKKTTHCLGKGLVKGLVVGALARAITGESDSGRAWGYGTTALVWGDCELSSGTQQAVYQRPPFGYGSYENPGEEAAYKRGESERLRQEQRRLEREAYQAGRGYDYTYSRARSSRRYSNPYYR